MPAVSQRVSAAPIFDEVIVSTDSKKIARIAIKYGASIPFIRPKKYSNDKATDTEVLEHFLKFYKKKINYLCYLYPTTPLLKIQTLKNCYNIISKKKYYNLITICKYSSKLDEAFKKNSRDEISYIKKNKMYKNSKSLKDYYYDAGQCYWYNFTKKKILKRSIGYEIPQIEGIDINTLDEFKLAKSLLIMKKINYDDKKISKILNKLSD